MERQGGGGRLPSEIPPSKSCGDPGLGCPQNRPPHLSLDCGQGWQVGFTSQVRVIPASWGRFSREWALVFSFWAEEAGVWHRSKRSMHGRKPRILGLVCV